MEDEEETLSAIKHPPQRVFRSSRVTRSDERIAVSMCHEAARSNRLCFSTRKRAHPAIYEQSTYLYLHT